VEGIDIAVKISRVPKDRFDRPTQDIRILKMEIVK
jgi:hypothetical protein